MATNSTASPEAMTHMFRIVRFAILCTLALTAVLLMADIGARNMAGGRFLSEHVVTAVIYAMAAQVIAAIAASTWLQLKSP
jgi:hypothetical protein